jgi:hypothetical protein
MKTPEVVGGEEKKEEYVVEVLVDDDLEKITLTGSHLHCVYKPGMCNYKKNESYIPPDVARKIRSITYDLPEDTFKRMNKLGGAIVNITTPMEEFWYFGKFGLCSFAFMMFLYSAEKQHASHKGEKTKSLEEMLWGSLGYTGLFSVGYASKLFGLV